MATLAKLNNYKSAVDIEYGSGTGMDSTAWDFDVMYGCECESSWPVGFGLNEYQLGEYFGADCSLRKSPFVLFSMEYRTRFDTSCLTPCEH